MNAPVCHDLASVETLYYLAIEIARYNSVEALCTDLCRPLLEVQAAVEFAKQGGSLNVVLDRTGPQFERLQVVLFEPGGVLVLCAAVFSHTESDEAQADAMLVALSARPKFLGLRFLSLGFRPTVKRVLQ